MNENEISKMYETKTEEQILTLKEEYETQQQELKDQLNQSIQAKQIEAEENKRLTKKLRQIQSENEQLKYDLESSRNDIDQQKNIKSLAFNLMDDEDDLQKEKINKLEQNIKSMREAVLIKDEVIYFLI